MNRWLQPFRSFVFIVVLLGLVLGAPFVRAQARLEVMDIPGEKLKDNPLHDPVKRQIAIFLPTQYETNQALPVMYYLPGYGGSAQGFIQNRTNWCQFVQHLADAVTPVVFVVVDARTRWGGSQYINSAAQGNYADYICDEIVPLFEQSHHVDRNAAHRMIAGHSSGGFGALRLGSDRAQLFGAIIALSPDSDFPTTHLSFAESPVVRQLSLAELHRIVTANPPVELKGDLQYVIALSHAYAAKGPAHPGEFEWLYNEKGEFQKAVWERWLENDPLTIVRNNPQAFRPEQRVYLEGAAQDQFKANIGARKIYEVLATRPGQSVFYEPPGKHSDHLPQRIERGLAWVFGKPLIEIK